jgi:hypothetical protein
MNRRGTAGASIGAIRRRGSKSYARNPRENAVIEVAALYIDERGPYPKLLGADACWGIDKDDRPDAAR